MAFTSPSFAPPPAASTRRQAHHRAAASRARRLGLVNLFACVMLVITGCIRMDMAITLHENDVASAQLDMAFQDSAIEAAGYDPAEFWAEAEAEIVGALPAGATHEAYPEAGWTGTRVTIPNVPFSELGTLEDGGFTGISVTREGNEYVFQTRSGMAEDFADFNVEDLPAGSDPVRVSMTLTCPGPIVEANGAITGNTVTWDLAQFTAAEVLTARCGAAAETTAVGGGTHLANDAGWFARWWPALLGGLLTLALLAFLGFYLRRKSHQEQNTASNFDHTADWGQPTEVSQSPIAYQTTEVPQPIRNAQPYLAPRTELVEEVPVPGDVVANDVADNIVVDETLRDNDADY